MKDHSLCGIFLAATLLAGCSAKEATPQALTPARGPEAPPMPVLPKIESGESGAAIAPTGGRTTGSLFPAQEAQIGPTAGGLITEVAVKEGARVKKGDLLFRQDARDAVLRVEQAKVALAGAQVNARAVETEYKRAEQMFQQNAMNRAQWEQMQSRFEGANVGVDQAQVALQMAQKSVADATVHAPFSGVITAKLKNAGETATMMPPTIVLVLQDQSTLELRFRFPEGALRWVKAGDRVLARVEALGLEREAKIVRVQPTVDARTRTIELVAEVANADGALRPGLLAEVRLEAGEVPTSSVDGKPGVPR